MNQNLNQEKILLDLAKADSKKFSELYKYLVNDVYRFAYSLTTNVEEAEDTVSKAFIKFYEIYKTYEWKDISLKYWFFRFIRNQCYEIYRLPKLVELDENIDSYEEISFVDQIMKADLLEKVVEEIQSLNPIEREIINLRIWEDMQFNTIAEIQSSTVDTTKKRFYRAIDKIKKSIESKGIKSVVTLPFLFTAVKAVGSTKAFTAPAQLINSSLNYLTISQIMDNTIKTGSFLASKAGIAAVSILTASILVVGGIVFTNRNKKDDKSILDPVGMVTPTPVITNKITQTPRQIITKTPTITQKPTSTPLPTETPTQEPTPETIYKNFDHQAHRFTFEYDEKMHIEFISSGAETTDLKISYSETDYFILHFILGGTSCIFPELNEYPKSGTLITNIESNQNIIRLKSDEINFQVKTQDGLTSYYPEEKDPANQYEYLFFKGNVIDGTVPVNCDSYQLHIVPGKDGKISEFPFLIGYAYSESPEHLSQYDRILETLAFY